MLNEVRIQTSDPQDLEKKQQELAARNALIAQYGQELGSLLGSIIHPEQGVTHQEIEDYKNRFAVAVVLAIKEGSPEEGVRAVRALMNYSDGKLQPVANMARAADNRGKRLR